MPSPARVEAIMTLPREGHLLRITVGADDKHGGLTLYE